MFRMLLRGKDGLYWLSFYTVTLFDHNSYLELQIHRLPLEGRKVGSDTKGFDHTVGLKVLCS